MEALSPRPTNIPVTPRQPKENIVKKDEVKLAKPKDHAPPPPKTVIQPPEVPGTLSVQYRTGRELGKGGFAICYEGRQCNGDNGGKTYALKIVKAAMTQKKMEEKFRTELQIHAKMRHPNIVEFHKAFTFRESTYVVLELCPCGSIQEMVRTRRGISLPEVRRMVVQLCGAIKYMHARNVIHRDLKMGNLFLDHEMNVKIGDFGLAAVLVSPGEHKGVYKHTFSKRTTLCGTPNYIAPEILNKEKGGHDLKVDIWALGCIIYAMICCRPPFQAGSSAEIYEKAKAIKYEWPNPAINNDIPDEIKDLVAALLRSEPSDRLSLDEVVSHPFFSMHGGDCIPAVIDPDCMHEQPGWLVSKAAPRGDVMHRNAPRLKIRDLGKACGVGCFDDGNRSFSVVGDDVDISLYKACLVEEVADSCPRVPLPADVVYSGKLSAEARSSILGSMVPPVPSMPKTVRGKPRRGLEPLPEDNAAELNQCQSSKGLVLPDSVEDLPDPQTQKSSYAVPAQVAGDHATVDQVRERRQGSATDNASMRVPSGLMNGRPIRMSKTLPRSTTRVTRSQTAGLTRETAIPIYDDEYEPRIRLTKDQIIDQLSPNPDEKRRQMAMQGKARIAANLQNELNALNDDEQKEPPKVEKEKKGHDSQRKFQIAKKKHEDKAKARKAKKSSAPDDPNVQAEKASRLAGWLISPGEQVERLPETSSTHVVARLEHLRKELDEAFHTAAGDLDILRFHLSSQSDGTRRPRDSPPLVTKWVDYTNRLGVGYTLANGSMGCLLKADRDYESPQCGVLVANMLSHYQRLKKPSYSEASQAMPRTGAPVEFSEDYGADGMTRLLVPADRFEMQTKADGVTRMRRTDDIYEQEKRRRVSIWRRFADYMALNLATDRSAGPVDAPKASGKHVPSPLLRFYQRLGSVSVWAFADGALQFNFPDHTKLMLHRDGKWIDFYCLPIDVLDRLRAGKPLEDRMLIQRSRLTYQATHLLGMCSDDEAKPQLASQSVIAVVKGNDAKKKIEFVRKVLSVWVREGGLGRLGVDKYLKWDGLGEKKGLAWASVGASGGDIHYKLPPAGEEHAA
ncbi:MAG: hypothetical protein Q9228_003827 [Teloschistes exilis]